MIPLFPTEETEERVCVTPGKKGLQLRRWQLQLEEKKKRKMSRGGGRGCGRGCGRDCSSCSGERRRRKEGEGRGEGKEVDAAAAVAVAVAAVAGKEEEEGRREGEEEEKGKKGLRLPRWQLQLEEKKERRMSRGGRRGCGRG